MSAHELLPCPFCGGDAVLKQYRADGLEIKCTGCQSMRQQRWMYKGRDWLEAKMIEKWNERSGYTAVDMSTAAAQGFRDGAASKEKIIDALLNHCEDGECHVCSQIICPHGDGMHFHHDGCPSCAQDAPE